MEDEPMRRGTPESPYRVLVIVLAIHFAIMYLVMYAMIATVNHFHFNLNTSYMTLMMVTPMALVMLVAMRRMYTSPPANIVIGAAALALFAVGLVCVRTQSAVDDRDFPSLDDPASFRSNPHVHGSIHHRSGDHGIVSRHRRGTDETNRADGGDPRALLTGARESLVTALVTAMGISADRRGQDYFPIR